MGKMGIRSVDELENLLSTPNARVVAAMAAVDGDIVILGAGGKMGPSLSRMAKRASDKAGKPRRVVAVSRFGSGNLRQALEAHGIETVACDLLDRSRLAGLPDAPNVVYMTGMKFGAHENESLTWAMNTWLPTLVCRY